MTETELLKVQLSIALEALTTLASWDEGAEVDNSFDSPHTATTARRAISDMTRARTGLSGKVVVIESQAAKVEHLNLLLKDSD
jgi:hypothetical protein